MKSIISLTIFILLDVCLGQREVTIAGSVKVKEEGSASFICSFPNSKPSDKRTIFFKKPNSNNQSTVAVAETLQGNWATNKYHVMSTEVDGTYTLIVTFNISDASLADSGTYECAVLNGSNIKLASAVLLLEVFANTDIIELDGVANNAYTVNAGESHLVTCKAYNGTRPTNMSIKIDDQTIALNVLESTSVGGNLIYVAEVRVAFNSSQDQKPISCLSQVETYEPMSSQQATLQVVVKPTVVCTPQTASSAVNLEQKFTCVVTGKPKPDIGNMTWTSQKRALKFNAGQSLPESGLSSQADSSGDSIKVTLTIKVSSISFEKYTLEVGNAHGISFYTVELTEDKNESRINGVSRQMLSYTISSLAAFIWSTRIIH